MKREAQRWWNQATEMVHGASNHWHVFAQWVEQLASRDPHIAVPAIWALHQAGVPVILTLLRGIIEYDLSWAGFSQGDVDAKAIYDEVGVAVESIDDLRRAIEALFAKHGPLAIAVKSQHAYERTLRWEPRTDADAERVLLRSLGGEELDEAERLCLGDWCMERGVEQAAEHNLPFKIHTGYYAGAGWMQTERIRPGRLSVLLMHHKQTRFVLMHNGYPYSDELVALVKHYPNAYMDMCWAWSIDPYSACDALRRAVHAAPSSSHRFPRAGRRPRRAFHTRRHHACRDARRGRVSTWRRDRLPPPGWCLFVRAGA